MSDPPFQKVHIYVSCKHTHTHTSNEKYKYCINIMFTCLTETALMNFKTGREFGRTAKKNGHVYEYIT